MQATGKSSRAVFLAIFFSLVATSTAYPQNNPFGNNLHAPDLETSFGTPRAKCATASVGIPGLWRLERLEDRPALGDGLRNEVGASNVPDGACITAAPEAEPVVPCRSAMGRADLTGVPPCSDAARRVPAPISAPGKEGLKISKARQAVMEILSGQNACSEWFKSKDAFPAQTLQSLSFEVDRRGQEEIFESPQGQGMLTLRHPYVAWAIQDGGPFTTVTINANGAFYRSQGRVEKISTDGGPLRLDGMRVLTVGPYMGDTRAAQIVTLLHELGHVIDLLPLDSDGLNGSSMRNTEEVQRHCREEVEARAQKKDSF